MPLTRDLGFHHNVHMLSYNNFITSGVTAPNPCPQPELSFFQGQESRTPWSSKSTSAWRQECHLTRCFCSAIYCHIRFLDWSAPCVLWLDCAECLIPDARLGAEVLSDGHQWLFQGRLPIGAVCWHRPTLGPFASGSLSYEEDSSLLRSMPLNSKVEPDAAFTFTLGNHVWRHRSFFFSYQESLHKSLNW